MPRQPVLDPAQAAASIAVVLVVLVVHVVLASRALADLRRDDRRVRLYPKQTWATLVTLVGIIGPVAYFLFGRDEGW